MSPKRHRTYLALIFVLAIGVLIAGIYHEFAIVALAAGCIVGLTILMRLPNDQRRGKRDEKSEEMLP